MRDEATGCVKEVAATIIELQHSLQSFEHAPYFAIGVEFLGILTSNGDQILYTFNIWVLVKSQTPWFP